MNDGQTEKLITGGLYLLAVGTLKYDHFHFPFFWSSLITYYLLLVSLAFTKHQKCSQPTFWKNQEKKTETYFCRSWYCTAANRHWAYDKTKRYNCMMWQIKTNFIVQHRFTEFLHFIFNTELKFTLFLPRITKELSDWWDINRI